MTAVVGVAYLLSALLKGTVAATVLTFFLFTLIFSIIGGILPRANVEPWFIPTSASGIIANALGGAAVRPGPGGGDVGFVPDPAISLLVFAAYAIAGDGKAYLRSRRKEIEQRFRAFESAVGPERAALFREFRATWKLLKTDMSEVTPKQADELRRIVVEMREKALRILSK